MTNFIPIFPLGIVVYPGEDLNLHIFEPRYIQLINESFTPGKPFGIPSIVDKRLQDYGTLVKVVEITKLHDNGEMDVKTKGEKVFRILEVVKDIPDKMYSGAIVNYPHNNESGNPEVMRRIMSSVRELHQFLKVSKDFGNNDEVIKTYDVAHHLGLSLQEEYELLNLMTEMQRQEFIRRHLLKVLPLLGEMESLKQKIKLNGHFKNLSSFNFGD